MQRSHDVRSREQSARRRKKLLLFSCWEKESTDALVLASAFCEVLDTDLYVARLLAARAKRPADAPAPDSGSVARATLAWHLRALGESLADERVFVQEKALAQALTPLTLELAPALVAIGASELDDASIVQPAVRETGVPLLIARPPSGRHVVLAATDLSDPRYPILREALEIAKRSVAPISFVHNVEPFDSEPRSRKLYLSRLVTLHSVAQQLGARKATLIVERPHTSEAILEVAQREGADLIVIGAHTDRRAPSSRRENVTNAVLERAQASVLVVPVQAAEVRS